MKIDSLMHNLYPLQRVFPDNEPECTDFAIGVFTTLYAVNREFQGLESDEEESFEDSAAF